MSGEVHTGEALTVLPSSHAGRRVGRYLLCDQIGSGGMATIVLARLLGPQGFSRTVAVKQLHPQFAQNPQFVAMLLDEARLAVRVRHVNVISPLDIVANGSELFIVMDYVNGESFANLLTASAAPLRPSLAATILVQVLLGLHAAHEATREQGEALGLVHRDVSPQNILVGQDGVARVLDFGIAKAVARTQTTDGGMVKGKLGYMAPEQVKLEAVDRRSDVFSAGVVLWEALTGAGLFTADTLGASIERLLHAEIAAPSRFNPAVTPELDAVVLRALARDRDARFQDAMSMAAALERALPLASALEVIDWVEHLAGPELAHRAELVRRAESSSWQAERALTLAPAPPGLRATELRTTGVARPAPEPGAGGVLMATGESTGVAMGSDREAPETTQSKGRRDWRSFGIALGIVLGGSTVALGVLALSSGQRESASARPSFAAQPPFALAAGAPSPEAPGSAAPELPSPELPSPELPSLARAPSAPRRPPASTPGQAVAPAGLHEDELPARERGRRAAASTAALARARGGGAGLDPSTSRSARSADSAAARRSARSRPAPAMRGSRGDSPAGRSAARTSHGAPSSASGRDACQPPWTIDEHQIKVFKAECLR